MHKLILASQSPRRYQLLSDEGWQFTVASQKVSEILKKNLNIEDQIVDLARQKAEAVVRSGKFTKSQDFLILAADTVVVLGQEILGKPQNIFQAKEFLCKLSGQVHKVITGICLWDILPNLIVTAHEISLVTFKKLSQKEIEDYVNTGEPLDKAGAYAIQGDAKKFVTDVSGSYTNVVGLPIELLHRLIEKYGWQIARNKHTKH